MGELTPNELSILDDLDARMKELDAEAEQRIAEQMRQEAESFIELDQLDPRQQRYMKNKTTGKLIRSNMDFHRMMENQHGYEVITYNAAYDLYKKEEAEKRAARAKILARKASRKSRKKNRKR